MIDECAGDSKKLFNLADFPFNDPNVNTLPAHDYPVLLANKYGEFFVKEIELNKDSIRDI